MNCGGACLVKQLEMTGKGICCTVIQFEWKALTHPLIDRGFQNLRAALGVGIIMIFIMSVMEEVILRCSE